MMVSDDVVASFLRARGKRPGWLEVPVGHRPSSVAEGYQVQRALHRAIEAAGDRRVGYKVGSTSKAGQRSFGLDQPVYAGIFAGTRSPDLATALAHQLRAPSLECEIAFRLATRLDGRAAPISRADAAAAVAECNIACEIIDNRYGDPLAVGVPSLLADDFFHAGFVIGRPHLGWQALRWDALAASIDIDGVVASGHSADVMDALTSLHWLVGKLAEADLWLDAGDIVLSGTIVPPTAIMLPARAVTLAIDGFAPLTLTQGVDGGKSPTDDPI